MMRGFTLLEMLVVMLVVAILAAMALPYAEMTVTRSKEFELQQALRQFRTSIDSFHADWEAGRISDLVRASSPDGYPVSLDVLVKGVPLKDGGIRRYLRRIPVNPFAEPGVADSRQQWRIRGYQDDLDAVIWNGLDVYDVRAKSDAVALNGTNYRDW